MATRVGEWRRGLRGGGERERAGQGGGEDGAEKDYAFKNGPPHP